MRPLQALLISLFFRLGCSYNYNDSTFGGEIALSSCQTHDDCADNQVCIKQKCECPCSHVCGGNTTCQVKNHVVSCSCKRGYHGNPFSGCDELYAIENWPPFAGAKKVYRVEAIKVNWYTAFAQCISHGGRLATITSSLENDQIKEVIQKSGLRPQFWASGIDYSLQDSWTWLSTGRPFAFTDWTPGQPDNWQNLPGGEHCLELWETGHYRWNDRNCMELQFPICEYYV